jgi:predicted signal transduction protein with EAL and GGDEF domain
MVVAERIRAAFESAARTVSGRYIGATVSVGVASHETAANIDALLARADAALYAAKANGRNRVEVEMPMVDLLQSSDADAEAEVEAGEPTVPGLADWASHPRPRVEELDRRAA